MKENTIPQNHAAARPPARNANRANQPTNRRRCRILVIGAVIAFLGLFFGIRYWMYASTHEDTDDAYVTGYTHQISSRITGTVQEVFVDDNWHVKAGQPLLKLDARDYQVGLQKERASYLQAQSQLLQATAQIPLAEAQLAQAQAQADSAKANSDYLQRTFERNRQLFYQGRGVISKQDLDTAQSQAETTVATYKANLTAVNVAKENLNCSRSCGFVVTPGDHIGYVLEVVFGFFARECPNSLATACDLACQRTHDAPRAEVMTMDRTQIVVY